MILSSPGSGPTLDLEYELLRAGHRLVAGVDEVGRGSLAGPVVAAAVVLPLHDTQALSRLSAVRDSKRLSARQRDDIACHIVEVAMSIGIGWASHHVIDRVGIAAANRAAMGRAVRNLSVSPEALVIDYVRLHDCDLPQTCVPQGDSRSLSVAAASILAKVVRDRWISRCHVRFPEYSFQLNKGYGTPAHRAALDLYGFSPLHRRSFRCLPPET